jgi:hypothetical protein
VRVGAREVRKRLAQFYVSPEAVGQTVRIDLVVGTYIPEFHTATAPPSAEPATVELPAVAPPNQPRKLPWKWIALGVAVAGVTIALTWTTTSIVHPPDDLDRFWGPVLESSDKVLIAMAHPIVYMPSHRAQELNDERFHPGLVVGQVPIELPPNELTGADMIPVFNSFVGLGDAVAAADVTRLLTRKNRASRLRTSSRLEYSDFRDQPAVLIGAMTNRWTLELGTQFHFRFNRSPERRPLIEETGTGNIWRLPAEAADGGTDEDFVLITRVLNSPTRQPFVVLAGLKQTGTEAAGRAITDAGQWAAIAKRLPSGWQKKNLQVVLHTKVIGGSPSAPEVVAQYGW